MKSDTWKTIFVKIPLRLNCNWHLSVCVSWLFYYLYFTFWMQFTVSTHIKHYKCRTILYFICNSCLAAWDNMLSRVKCVSIRFFFCIFYNIFLNTQMLAFKMNFIHGKIYMCSSVPHVRNTFFAYFPFARDINTGRVRRRRKKKWTVVENVIHCAKGYRALGVFV